MVDCNVQVITELSSDNVNMANRLSVGFRKNNRNAANVKKTFHCSENFICLIFFILFCSLLYPQFQSIAQVTDSGYYSNPIIHADYSDPDVVRVGNNYYLTSSSFTNAPGLPILTSTDLVHWKIIGHAVERYPFTEFDRPQHGKGIWAPSLRFHDGFFYIYFGDPDHGILMTKAKNPAGPWEPLTLVKEAKGWIDPCPLWDDDGNVYLVHAWANSRAGFKSILTVNKMNSDGTKIVDDGVTVYDGHRTNPTIEGPKFYKKDGYYYIFAPAGGVPKGWQTILRSKNIYGPYEERIVLAQGSTSVNGPHQGAWIDAPNGESWFVHFQDKEAYGRIVHLQPLTWSAGWPLIGTNVNEEGRGEPVQQWNAPFSYAASSHDAIPTSDEFESNRLGLQWQWNANPQPEWYSLTQRNGWLRLFSSARSDSGNEIWNAGNVLTQKIQSEQCEYTVRILMRDSKEGAEAGIIIFGIEYAFLQLKKSGQKISIAISQCVNAEKNRPEEIVDEKPITSADAYLRVSIDSGAVCTFSFSTDGKKFLPIGTQFTMQPGKWVGASVGLFCRNSSGTNNNFADFDYIRVNTFDKGK